MIFIVKTYDKEYIFGNKYGLQNNKGIIVFEWIVRSITDLSPLLFSIIWAKLIDTSITGIQNNSLSFELLLIPFILYGIIEFVKAVMTWLGGYLQNRIFDILELKFI